MKKKLLALLLALTMGLTLAACSNDGGASDKDTESSAAPSTEPSASAEESAQPSKDAQPEDSSDLAYVKDKGTLVVGITNFEPMDYQDAGGQWIGFDADMAKAFAASLSVEVEFIEINWGFKVFELEAKNIDCVWNGMTLNDEVMAAMGTSVPYCQNAQVLVVPADKAADYENLTTLEGLNIAVESGSAGEDAAEALGASTTPVQKQSDTLLEVSAGTSDAAVIDLLMAGAMIGEGTSYSNLTYVLNLNTVQGLESENYGVGFRPGSDLVEAFNDFWAASVADGTALSTAETYGVQESVILK